MFGKDIAIDLGTATTIVYVKGSGILVNEPTIVALERRSNKVFAVGMDARRMAGRTTDDIYICRPLKDGVIAEFSVTESMLSYFIDKALSRNKSFWSFLAGKPRVIVGIPSGATQVEKRAVEEATLASGAREVYLIDEPMSAAIGAGLPVMEPRGCMVLDIGGGTTEAAVISMGGIVASMSSRIAGDEMNEEVSRFFRHHYNLLIGDYTAEDIKINIGSAFPYNGVKTAPVKGRDLISGLPRMVEANSDELRDVLQKIFAGIADLVKSTLEITPPELSADVLDRGMMLAGGGALIKGLDQFLTREIGIPVHIAPKALESVALGAGKALSNLSIFRKVLFSSKTNR